MTTKLGRRGFLMGLGAGAAAGVAGCTQRPQTLALPFLIPPEDIVPGVSVQFASTCTACPSACGLLVTVRDGRPVKLEGHPEHPESQGGLCAYGQADLRALYHSGRPQGPAIGGQPASWADVDTEVAARLAGVKKAGKQVAVLTASVSSPTVRAALERFAAATGATVVEHDPSPEAPSAALEAWELLTGRALRPALRIDAADLLVVLGADLLGAHAESVAHTRRYVARKRGEGRFRHVQIEGTLTSTGALADERWQATAAEERRIALGLLRDVAAAREGGAPILEALAGQPASDARVQRLARALLAAPGRSLVVSGSDDLGEQVAVALVNRLLGNEGTTLDLERPSLAHRGLDRDLDALRASLADGKVGALILVGRDPVAEEPDGDTWAAWLRAMPLSISVADRPTASAEACKVVAAAHHGLEQWGDAMPRPGVLTVVQPTIRPLFDTRHPVESLHAWSGDAPAESRDVVKLRWEEQVFPKALPAAFGGLWSKSLSRGLAPADAATIALPEAKAPPLGEALAALSAPGPADGALEVALVSEVAVRDGSRAHVPWLRELPDPITRVTWVPVVRVAPATAKELGVEDGAPIEIAVGDAKVTMAARITPGQHPKVLGVPIGYAEQNGARLARWDGARVRRRGLPAAARKVGEATTLPAVQREMHTHDRPIVHQVSAPDEHVPAEGHGEHASLWAERTDDGPIKWEMVIDLDACTACGACVVSCQSENNVPTVGPEEVARWRDMGWLRVDRYFTGDDADPEVLFEPMLCQQCGHASCETVCPVLATVHSTDGISQQIYNRCIGTRYCANNCAYKMRRFNWFEYDHGGPVERLALNPDVVVRERGVMEKCTFCTQRIQAARIEAHKAGNTGTFAVKTACEQSCPASAITFGDARDPSGAVVRLKKSPRAFQVFAELGVRPAVTYLARVRRKGESA